MYLYLEKNTYKSSNYGEPFKAMYPKEIVELEKKILDRNFASVDSTVLYQVGYWRKDNAIHQWFVEHCGEGKDECQKMYVTIDQLKELRQICEKIIADNSLAEALLPTCDGFFFGDIEYDEWYFKGILYTKELLDDVIAFVESDQKGNSEYDVVYQASW